MMTRPTVRRRLLSLALAAALSGSALAQNFEPFTVGDIRVDGLQRISAGTVFTYLPVEKGDVLDRSRSSEAIRALFKTGFFSSVKLERQDNILVISVVERPAINTLTLEGNKALKSEDLLKGLKGIGLSEGETYNPLNLDRVTQELTRQYNNRGKYGVTISPTVTTLDRNRVDIKITIAEGKNAKIRDINIVGNDLFPDADIRENWESSTHNWLSWYRRDDQYSREKVSGDLEKLSNFYLDRGYVDYNLESTQIAISPTKEDLFITANISEGERYKVSGVKVSGDTVVPQEQVEKMVLIKPDAYFSRALLELTTDSITLMLANIGYAFAEVNPVPEVNRENHTVAINFVVKPGPRVTVRRIVFKGNAHTSDEVMRREMRQFESAWYSQAAIDRSKIRLQRTGFFETVDIDTPKVEGKNDQVDVVVTVKERNAGTFVFGLGYSQNVGLVTSIQLQQNNFLGTGNQFSIALQNNNYSKSISFSYVDPYFTQDGVTVGYNLSYSDYSQSTTQTARYGSGNAAGEISFGVPLSENTSVNAALGIFRNQITTYDGSTPPEVIDYLVSTLGDRARYPVTQIDHSTIDDDNNPATPSTNDDSDPSTPDGIQTITGGNRQWTVNAWTFRAGWARDTRNDYLLPTRGMLNRISIEAALPGSDLTYYKLSYDFEHYWPIARWLVLKSAFSLGYGNSYGDTSKSLCHVYGPTGNQLNTSGGTYDPAGTIPAATASCGLPFFKNFYAGGPGSVRGFTANTLGPNVSYGGFSFVQPLGGSVKTVGSFELAFPKLVDAPGTRLSLFFDYGYVYARPSDFQMHDFRTSAGIALQWQSPVGPISISYAFPLDHAQTDQIEKLQFTFGGQTQY
jgi:outer membrane protein insertion porin family